MHSHSHEHNDVLYGVGCTVTNCHYNNKEDMCTADRIMVNTQRNSVNETDTFCDTFVAEEQDI